jgi:hypothetical protein
LEQFASYAVEKPGTVFEGGCELVGEDLGAVAVIAGTDSVEVILRSRRLVVAP